MIKRGSFTLSIGSSFFLLDGMKCLFSSNKCKKTVRKGNTFKIKFRIIDWLANCSTVFCPRVIIVANFYRLSNTRYDSSNNLEIE